MTKMNNEMMLLTVLMCCCCFVCVQLVWLVRELVKSGMMGADGVVMTLLKQIAGQTLTHAVYKHQCHRDSSCVK